MGIDEIRRIHEDAEKPKEPKKRKPIPKFSKKKEKQLKEQRETHKKDEEFYKEIYAASPHQCQNCGCKLPKTPSNFMFHHLLEKRNYPQYRYAPENVMILCLECHSKAETNIEFAPKIAQRRIEAEQKCHLWGIIEND